MDLCRFIGSCLIWSFSEMWEELMSHQSPQKKPRNQQVTTRFFKAKADIAKTHAHIIDWFDDCTDKEVRNDIIKNCFRKEGQLWKLDLDKPFFKESKIRFCEHHGSLYGSLGIYNFRMCSVALGLYNFRIYSFRSLGVYKFMCMEL